MRFPFSFGRRKSVVRRRYTCYPCERLETRRLLATQLLTTVDPVLSGASANGASSIPSISADGQVIAFYSSATNLVSGVEVENQIYALQRATNTMSLVTTDRDGGPADFGGRNPVVSADGRSVLFFSATRDLVPQTDGQDLNRDQLYLRDLASNTTRLISVTADGQSAGNADSGGDSNSMLGGVSPSVYAFSRNGRFVVFWSRATDLVTSPVSAPDQLYVRDLLENTTTLVSRDGQGQPAGAPPEPTEMPFSSVSISDDGRYVSFATRISLVAEDSDTNSDVYVRDLIANTTELVSIDPFGGTFTGNDQATAPVLSGDGRQIAFLGIADFRTQVYLRNLVDRTTVIGSPRFADPTQGANGRVASFTMSRDGRYIAFDSDSSDHVPGDTNTRADIFLRDTVQGTTTLVTQVSGGSNGYSFTPLLSASGRTIVFGSYASNLVENFDDQNNSYPDFYAYDVDRGTLRLLTRDHEVTGRGGTSDENISVARRYAVLSDDGSVIAFRNLSANLTPDDNNRELDVFISTTDGTQLVSRRDPSLPAEMAAGGWVMGASDDGRYVMLSSPQLLAGTLAPLYLRDTVTGAVTAVDPGTGFSASSASISPDGRYIVFTAGQAKLYDRVTNTLEVISVTPSGSPSNGSYSHVDVSADGRYVVFVGNGTDLIDGLTDANNSLLDVFLRDRQTQTTVLVNRKLDTTITTGNGGLANRLQISTNGRRVLFDSVATDLTSDASDTANLADVYLFDVASESLELVSTDATGSGAAGGRSFSASADCRYVAFDSAGTLLPGVTGRNVYLRDVELQTTHLINVALTGHQPSNGFSEAARITPDGRFVAFQSTASDLTAEFAGPLALNVFVRDRLTETTMLASAAPDGIHGADREARLSSFNIDRTRQVISANGRYVIYASAATNLLADGASVGLHTDLYRRDLVNRQTVLISRNRTGEGGGNQDTSVSSFADAGKFVVLSDGRVIFNSLANNLVDAFDPGVDTDAFLTSPDAPAGGTLRGHVFNDLNRDGIRGDAEQGIQDAVVFLDANGNGQYDPGESAVRTSADGRYEFLAVPRGEFRIVLTADADHVTTAPADGGYTVAIDQDGQVIEDRDFGQFTIRADLVVESVTVATLGTSSATAEVTWEVVNRGTANTRGERWQDAVYLSRTPEFGPDATLLSTVNHDGLLGEGATYQSRAVVSAALTLGDPAEPYYILVQTDRRLVIDDAQRQNNVRSSAPMQRTIPTLEPGVPLDDVFTASHDPHFYQIVADRGQTLTFRVDGAGGVTELYVRGGSLPSPWEFDFRATAISPDQLVNVPVLDDQVLYVMVRAAVPADVHERAFTVRVDRSPLSIARIDTNASDAGGSVTIGIDGADFTRELTATLTHVSGTVLLASRLHYVHPALVYAEFDLRGAPIGTYDLHVEQLKNSVGWPVLEGDDVQPVQIESTEQTASLPQAFTVLEAQPDRYEIEIDAPLMVRAGRDFNVLVTFRNTGTHELAAPLLEVRALDRGFVFRSTQGNAPTYSPGAIEVMALSRQTPSSIVRPGELVQIEVLARADLDVGDVTLRVAPVDDRELIDFSDFIRFLGDDPTTGRGAERLARLVERYGGTFSSLLTGLRAQASELARIGQSLNAVPDLLLETALRSTSAPANPRVLAATGIYDPDSEFNRCGGGPTMITDDNQLICRELVLGSVAAAFLSLGAPLGSFHLYRFLGELGPSAPPSNLEYGPGGLVVDDIKAHYTADWSYDRENTNTKQWLEGRVTMLADELPEGTSQQTLDGRKVSLNFYEGGSLPVGKPLAFNLSVAFGRIAGQAEAPLTFTKTKDRCGGYEVEYKGKIRYTFDDEYGFHSDGGSMVNRIVNGYAQNLQEAGYAGAFRSKIYIDEEVDGVLFLPPKTPPPPECKPDPEDLDGKTRPISVIRAFDPNDIVGPSGVGPDHHRLPGGVYPYTIHFENSAELAQAPAQEVFVSHTLDADLDGSTFELGSVGFGDLVINVPEGLRSYQTRVDYRNQDGSPLIVDVQGEFDLSTGTIQWTFRSVDPVRGGLPEGAFDGFLPVNDDSGRGEGFVNFTVRPREGLTSPVRIDAQAAIVFDMNDPLATNVYTNIIDSTPPTSSVQDLPANSSNEFIVQWSGSDGDAGAGIAYYDVYVSDNGGVYALWQEHVTATSASFVGTAGRRYAFYSVAVDQVGLRETKLIAAEATTTVVVTAPWQNAINRLDVTADGIVVPFDALLIINELNQPQFSDPANRRLRERDDRDSLYFDVNGDGYVSPIDALLVINFLSEDASEAEGESPDVVTATILAGAVDGVFAQVTEMSAALESGRFRGSRPPSFDLDVSNFLARRPARHALS